MWKQLALIIAFSVGSFVQVSAQDTSAEILKWDLQTCFEYAKSSIILSFMVCAITGVFFGYYPALKASKLDPIEALRYE